MAHILPHWNWPGRQGQVTPVHVYTSGVEAELFLNGQSLGRKKKEAYEYRLRWDEVTYSQKWAEDVVKTTGPAEKVTLSADRSTIAADGSDLSFVTVTIAAKDGLLVPRSKNLVKFTLTGPGEIAAVDNGDATSLAPFKGDQIKAFNGLALVIIRSKAGAPGTITLKAESQELSGAEVSITSKALGL